MTMQWIRLEALEPHPESQESSPPNLVEKVRSHIGRTGLYQAVVVRPIPLDLPRHRYQIINGHLRVRVLRELGHTRVRCDVWEVDDEEARLLLTMLNGVSAKRVEALEKVAKEARADHADCGGFAIAEEDGEVDAPCHVCRALAALDRKD